MTLQGSGRGGTVSGVPQPSQAVLREASPAHTRPEQLISEYCAANPWERHAIYCHGELQLVSLTSEGAVCSCCGTLIRWYVW